MSDSHELALRSESNALALCEANDSVLLLEESRALRARYQQKFSLNNIKKQGALARLAKKHALGSLKPELNLRRSFALGMPGRELKPLEMSRRAKAQELGQYQLDCRRQRAAIDRARAAQWRRSHDDYEYSGYLEEARQDRIDNQGQESQDDQAVRSPSSPNRQSQNQDALSSVWDSIAEALISPTTFATSSLTQTAPLHIITEEEPTGDANWQRGNDNVNGDAPVCEQGDGTIRSSDSTIKPQTRVSSLLNMLLQVDPSTPTPSPKTSNRYSRFKPFAFSRTSLAKKNTRQTVLNSIKPKSPKADRMSVVSRQAAERAKLKKQDEVRLKEDKAAAFESLTAVRKTALIEAFDRCDADGTGSLDVKELKKSLADLGVVPKNAAEKKAITNLCKSVYVGQGVNFLDFVFDVLPKASGALHELRKGALLEEFEQYDSSGDGLLNLEEAKVLVASIVEKELDSEGGTVFKNEFTTIFEHCQTGHGVIDFEGFGMLMGLIEERIAQIRCEREKRIGYYMGLTPDLMKKYRGELVQLFSSFENADSDGSGVLEKSELIEVMLARGLSLAQEKQGEQVHEMLEKVDRQGAIGFSDFLLLVSGAREDAESEVAGEQVLELFHKYDRDRSGAISFQEASLLVMESGLLPECAEDQQKIVALLEECDQDGSGDIDMEEFAVLLQKVLERLRAETYEYEKEVGDKLGYTDKEVSDLRESFKVLDPNNEGSVSIEDLRGMLLLLGMDRTPFQIGLMLSNIDRAHIGSGYIDFILFMKFMRDIVVRH